MLDEQSKIHEEKLDCIKEGYLSEFLTQHEQKITTILYNSFDEQVQREQYEVAVRAEERAEEREENIKNTVITLKESFPTLESVVETVMKIFKPDRQTAAAKVTAYWN